METKIIRKTNKENGKVKKIQCRNSYERKIVHDKAKELNILSRSVIDYNSYHINQTMTRSSCCYDCLTGTISFTPYSYVELGNELNEFKQGKIILGNPDMLPKSSFYNCIRIQELRKIIKCYKNNQYVLCDFKNH